MKSWLKGGSNILINANVATKVGTTSDQTVYGAQLINSGCHSWEISIEHKSINSLIYIGIASTTNHCNNYFVYTSDPYNFAYCSNGTKYVKSAQPSKYGPQFSTGDRIGVYVDFSKANIRFSKNNQTLDVIPNIYTATSYRIAVSMRNGQNSETKVKMIKYNDGYQMTINEEKELQISTKETKQQNEIQQLKTQIMSLKQSKTEQLNQIQQLTMTNSSLENIISNLQHEKKEMETVIELLQNENKILRLKSLNIDKYTEWKSDEIVYWIISLENGKFKKYENNMKAVLDEENIDGSCLEDVEASDMKTWGIVDFKDRKTIFRHMRSLVEKSQNIKQLNEGHNAPTAYI